MKIALLSFEFPPETGFGGIGTYTWHHARALVELGHEVHVLAGAREPTTLRAIDNDGVLVHRLRADDLAMRAFASLGRVELWWTRQRLENAWNMYRGIARLHRQHRYDVIEMPECGAEGALVTRFVKTPTVVRLHSPSRLIMPYYEVRHADLTLCSAIEQRAMRSATALTACSRFVADEVTARLHIDRPIPVISNGLDLDWFDASTEPVDVYRKYRLPRRQLLIVFTGRMERRKGIHLCSEIALAILERFDVTFVLAGEDLFGHVSRTLLPAVTSRRLKGSIHWLGALPLPDVRQLVQAADVFLLPSLWENCPYSCLEAMAAGRAIVAADQGGMPELIDNGVNGLLAPSGDAGSFTRQIERLIDDAELRRTLGVNARETIVRAHLHTNVARQALKVYESLIAGRPPAPRERAA
ncbi:MAG TPA: glycosyltransferase family 4 protein [Vicinamibacterales bacterium]|nr:glycosyltransferase family 4 protein [Vicinamibacterales bacterium]